MEEEKTKKKRFHIIWNKYVIVSVIFLVWIAFFDENNLVDYSKNKQRLEALKAEKENYQEKIREDNRKIEELRSGQGNLEKYAREQFHMSKPDEDVFIIVEEE